MPALAILLASLLLMDNATTAQEANAKEGAVKKEAVVEEPARESAQPAKPELTLTALRAQALMALQKEDNQTAIAAADAMVRQAPKDPRTARTAGDIYLRAGKVEFATKLFNRFVQAEPEQLPELWQRGISLYFSGDYDEAVKQFEEHRRVNPHDVENAAWHFLCVAKAQSIDKARLLVLPAPGDPRIPMQEVLEMLSDGKTDAVIARVQEVPAGSDARDSADFYGDFYLGLYADALGDKEKSLMYLRRCAKSAPHNYMGDIARVYAKHLDKKGE